MSDVEQYVWLRTLTHIAHKADAFGYVFEILFQSQGLGDHGFKGFSARLVRNGREFLYQRRRPRECGDEGLLCSPWLPS